MDEPLPLPLLKRVAKAVSKTAQEGGISNAEWNAKPERWICPKCNQPTVTADHLNWRDCENCGWKERQPTDLREAQKSFPQRYLGHTIRVQSDAGGGHKACVYKTKSGECLHVTKRHASPENAAHSAKLWINERRDADSGFVAKTANPSDSGKMTVKKQSQVLFDPGHEHAYLVEAARKMGSTLTPQEKVAELRRKYRVVPFLAEKAVQYAAEDQLSQREAQTILQNPKDTSIAPADPELNDLRTQATNLQAQVTKILAQGTSYMNALANKAAAGAKLKDTTSGIAGLQQEVGRLQGELETAIQNLPQNFVRFSDQCVVAKVQSARLNDASWSQIINAAKERGKATMQRVALILDRVSAIYRKMTANVSLVEMTPEEATPKELQKITDKNVSNVDKINKFQQKQQDIAPTTQRYFMENANGRIGPTGT